MGAGFALAVARTFAVAVAVTAPSAAERMTPLSVRVPPSSDPAVVAKTSADLTAYLNAEFEKELAMSPESLTQIGRKDSQDKLDDYSEAEQAKELDWRRKSVADMKAKFDPKNLDTEGQTSFDMWAYALDQAEDHGVHKGGVEQGRRSSDGLRGG